VIGSGRTDAGVHAEAQVANFRTRTRIPLKKLRLALNSRLPEDIAVTRIEEAPRGFNARKSARSKLYRYTIMNSDYADPLLRYFAARCFYKLDLDLMRKAARRLKGRHDFRSFQAVDGAGRISVRTMKNIKIEKDGNLVYIYMEADGFLYNMARSIAGTLIEVGRGKFDSGRIEEMLSKRERSLSGPTMPAKGLCMVRVRY